MSRPNRAEPSEPDAVDEEGMSRATASLTPAQGVVALAFDELLPETRMAVAKRPVNWATSAVDANSIGKYHP